MLNAPFSLADGAAIAAALSQRTGVQWAATPPERRDRPYVDLRLCCDDGPNGAQGHAPLALRMRQDTDRLEARPLVGDELLRFPPDAGWPVITISPTRPPEAIAGEIARRLVPAADLAIAASTHLAEEARVAHERRVMMTGRLVTACVPVGAHVDQNTVYLDSPWGGAYVSVEVSGLRSDTTEIRATGVPLAIAEGFLRGLVATLRDGPVVIRCPSCRTYHERAASDLTPGAELVFDCDVCGRQMTVCVDTSGQRVVRPSHGPVMRASDLATAETDDLGATLPAIPLPTPITPCITSAAPDADDLSDLSGLAVTARIDALLRGARSRMLELEDDSQPDD